MTRTRVLLGVNNENEVVFADIDTDRGYFSVSFDMSYPEMITEKDIKERIDDMVFDNLDKEPVWDLIVRYDCRPSELVEYMYEDSLDPVEEFYDNSYFPEEFTVAGYEGQVYMIASRGGQSDPRDEGMQELFVPHALYDGILHMWDEYHLKRDYPADEVEDLVEGIEDLDQDYYNIVSDWLHRTDIDF